MLAKAFSAPMKPFSPLLEAFYATLEVFRALGLPFWVPAMGVCAETMGFGLSGHPHGCPARAFQIQSEPEPRSF